MTVTGKIATTLLTAAALFAVTAAAAQNAPEPEPNWIPVTAIKVAHPPNDPCTSTCAIVAAAERDKAGPPSEIPTVYRVSASQASVTRITFVQNLASKLKVSTVAADRAIPTRTVLIGEWADLEPKGDFRADDVADVFAKFWIFSWVYAGGVNPNNIIPEFIMAVKEQAHRIFESDPVLSKFTEGQRQGFAETLMRLHEYSMMQLWSVTKDTKQLAAMMENVGSQFQREFGVDLFTLSLTNKMGFVLKPQ